MLLYEPDVQALHTRSAWSLPLAMTRSPGAQSLQALQPSALLVVLNVPFAHALQVWSCAALPEDTLYWPAAHAVHALQLVAFALLLKWPEGHALQLRSLSASPAAPAKLPGLHVVCATHCVAGLASWSHSPSAQGLAAAPPPVQYVPALQAAHWTAAAAEPSAVRTVPAGHSPFARQADSFAPLLNVPCAQGAHVRSTTEEGVFATYEPAAQLDHASH
jgi:hypothetical protein